MAGTHRKSAVAKSARVDALVIPDGLPEELEALAAPGDGEGYTMAELTEATGHSRQWVSRQLWKLQEQSRLHVGERVTQRIDKRRQVKPVYRWDSV